MTTRRGTVEEAVVGLSLLEVSFVVVDVAAAVVVVAEIGTGGLHSLRLRS